MLKNNFKKILPFIVIPVLVTAWFYIGEPQIFGFPPKAEKVEAAISYQDAGTANVSSAGGTLLTPTFPSTVNANDLLILIIGMKPSSANSGSVTTPDGWTLITSLTGAGGYNSTLGADTGNTNVFAYYKIAKGSEDGLTLRAYLSTNNVSVARIFRLNSSIDTSWNIAGTTGSDETAGADISIAMSTDPGVIAGDHIIGAMIVPTDAGAGSRWSGEALTQEGITFGTVNEIAENLSGTGNDLGAVIFQASVSSGISSGTPTFTATAVATFNTNARGPGVFIRVREVPKAPTFYNNDGGINQVAFNNIRQSTTTPLFRVSSPYFSGSSTSDSFKLELNTASDFSGTAYTQTFSGTYASGTAYNLYANNLSPSLPTTDGVSYYVRARASTNGGTTYGDWSTTTQAFTYVSSGDVDWFQTTGAQFNSGILNNVLGNSNGTASIKYATTTGMYFTNFSEYATGSSPTGWTKRYDTTGTVWMVRDDSTAVGGKVLRVEGSAAARRGLSWDILDSVSADADIFFRYKLPAPSANDIYSLIRGSGADASTANTYRIGHNINSGYEREISKYVSGTYGAIAGNSMYEDVDVWYNARANFSGTALKYKTWLASTSEPETWNLETTDSSISAAGWIGLFAFTNNSGVGASIDSFGVNISGGVAPTSTISTSTIISPIINFDSTIGVTTWDKATWSTTEANGTTTLQVYYATNTECNTVVPNSALSGNESGYASTSSPLDLSGLSTSTYSKICLKATLNNSNGTPTLNDWAVSWIWPALGTAGAPTFYDVNGTNQISFNNITQSTTTPLFRASATSTTNFNRFQLELNSASDFSGTAYIQTFSGTYASGTAYNLYANSLSPSLPTTDGVTYYVRARTSVNGGANYGDWSTEVRSFTYKSSGSAEWFQTTDKQFQSGTISNATTSGSGSIYAQSFVATGGSTSTSGGYKYHIFNTSGTFSVTSGSNAAQVLVVAGGGGGGSGGNSAGGGGGAGGLVYNSSYSLSVGDYTVTVGNGGAGGIRGGSPAYGVTGDNSVFGSITALGGGGGHYSGADSDASGGSGGGGAGWNVYYTGGTGTSGQGNDGGSGYNSSVTAYAGAGGGGGSGGVGSNGALATGGNGGAGSNYSSIFGTSVGASGWFAGGGGGAGYTIQGTGQAGGSNGSYGATSSNATANTGSGGGGATGGYSGGAGGSGFVGIRYPDTATGTIMSPQISFSLVPGAAAWDQVTWSETETNGNVTLQVYYATSSGCNSLIPDSALSGNSSGFSSGPIDISGLSTSTYANICLKATLNYSSGSPYLNDWKVGWGSGGTPSISQLNYRWRNDDGGEVTATYAAATNTAITTGVYVGDRIRLRFQLSNSGTGKATGYQYRLEYASMSDSCSTWTTVPSYGVLGPWAIDSSSYVYENLNTTDSTGITNPSGKSFIAGYIKTVGNQTPAITLNTNEFTEIEYSIRSLSNVSTDVAYCFRTTNAGSTSNFTYTVQPKITVLPIVIHSRGGNGYDLESIATTSLPVSGGDVGGGTSTEPVSPVTPTTTSTTTPGQGGGDDVGLLDGRGESLLATVFGGFFENYLLSFIRMMSGYIHDIFNVVNGNDFA